MNKTYLLIALGCASTVSIEAGSFRSPFKEMRKMFDQLDQMFEEQEQFFSELRRPLSFSHTMKDDSIELQFKGVEGDIKAELESNTLTITSPHGNINISAHPRALSIRTSSHSITEHSQDKDDEKDQHYARQESWGSSSATLPLKGKVQLEEIAQNPKELLQLNQEKQTLTVRIPLEKTSTAIPVTIVGNTDKENEIAQEAKKAQDNVSSESADEK